MREFWRVTSYSGGGTVNTTALCHYNTFFTFFQCDFDNIFWNFSPKEFVVLSGIFWLYLLFDQFELEW